MSKAQRVFEAPVDEVDTLPLEQSAWHIGRDAYIPLGHWEIIIEFAKELDPDKASMLEDLSVGSIENDSYVELTDQDMNMVLEFMELIRVKLKDSEPKKQRKQRGQIL